MNRKSTKGSTKTPRKTQDTSESKPTTTYNPAEPPSELGKTDTLDEEIRFPEFRQGRDSLSPKEAEAALRDLFDNGTENSSISVGENDAVVRGFREGIRLMPHQIPNRA